MRYRKKEVGNGKQRKCRTSGKVKTWFSSVKLLWGKDWHAWLTCGLLCEYERNETLRVFTHMKNNVYFKGERLA